MKLINDPILILQGDAGVGKSHLIAEVVERREKAKQTSILFLGQKFTTDEDAFAQMTLFFAIFRALPQPHHVRGLTFGQLFHAHPGVL